MNIDIVYLWVDGNDPVWRAKKEAFERGVPHSASEALAEARFVDNDELKYSLRSVERFAPWIHHIYIVTDGQVPAWIDLTDERISIVDHTEIMPREALPSFSSPAIEWCIDNIPGLSGTNFSALVSSIETVSRSPRDWDGPLKATWPAPSASTRTSTTAVKSDSPTRRSTV